ncbi:MAG: peptidoglycan DD-metalloendopeptidase family protein [Methylotenera sp.]|nr:peptidoglycan DD-metalloendopeptidase family protein [Methylotenera sp.]
MNHKYFKQALPYTALFAMLLLLAPLANANKKVEQSKQNLNEVHQRLESLKKELDSSKEAHKDAADALKESEVAISAANRKLYDINQQQQKNKKTLSKLASDSIATNQSLSEQQKLLSSQLYLQYTQGQQSYAQIILQNENPSAIARDVHYFSYVAKARAALIHKMQGNLTKINQLNDETAAALKEVAELKQKQLEEKKALENQKQTKSKVVSTLSQQIATQRNEIKKLSRDEKSLSQLVERLAKIVPPRPKKIPKLTPKDNIAGNASPTQSQPPKEVIANNAEPSSDSAENAGANFAALRGKLRLPVRGDVTNRFGSSREEGISWKGLFIKANEGAEVKSIATGRVVFADWMRGFGNLIIVDHGDGYMSLYGNNQAVLKQVGESVKAGDAIASVGNSGGNETNGLYYELRRQSRPFDPLSWSRLN